MFSPEKLLGGLLRGGSRRGGASLLTSQLGMGLLGVAIEAVDHYMKKSSAQTSSALGASAGSVPPPVPGAAAVPPAPPAAGPVSPPPSALPAGATAAAAGQKEAIVLIRAMIAAANADGAIDQEERQRILDKFQGADLSQEEHSFLINELFSPADLEGIVGQVHSEALARQVYGVSLLAIAVDTEAERAYIRTLGQRLGLSQADRDSMHKALGIENL